MNTPRQILGVSEYATRAEIKEVYNQRRALYLSSIELYSSQIKALDDAYREVVYGGFWGTVVDFFASWRDQ